MEISDERIGEMIADIKWIKRELEQAPRKYSAKWVQHVVSVLTTTGGVAVIGALLGLVLIKPARAMLLSLF